MTASRHEEARSGPVGGQAAQSIAAPLTRSAQHGPIPVATGASPIDGVAASVAGGVAAKVAASAADIAPRSADGLAKTQAAMTEAQAQDEKNAAGIKEVAADMVQGNRRRAVVDQRRRR
jgi:hypothetical protein